MLVFVVVRIFYTNLGRIRIKKRVKIYRMYVYVVWIKRSMKRRSRSKQKKGEEENKEQSILGSGRKKGEELQNLFQRIKKVCTVCLFGFTQYPEISFQLFKIY